MMFARRTLIAIVLSVPLVLAITALLFKETLAQVIAPQYELLQEELKSESDAARRDSLQIFLDLTYSFYKMETIGAYSVPQHVVDADPGYKEPAMIRDWALSFCSNRLQSAFHGGNDSVSAVAGRLYDNSWVNYDSFKVGKQSESYEVASLGNINAITKGLVIAIVRGQDKNASDEVFKLLLAIRKNKVLYERKYERGFRNRNIAQYYLDSSFHRFVLGEKKGLLSPPNSNELILLSKPQLVVATNSLNTNFNDQNNFYLLVQVFGWDWFDRDFKRYWGGSIFSSFPVNASPFENAFWGIEGHWSNKALIGFGWSFSNSDYKLQVSLPAFVSALPGF